MDSPPDDALLLDRTVAIDSPAADDVGAAGVAADTPDGQPPARTKAAYPAPAPVPTQAAEHGVRFDFNLGARVTLPAGRDWFIRLRDLDTGNILFESRNAGATVLSSKRFFVRFGIEVWADGRRVLVHDYDCRDRDVLIQLPVGTLGDTLAWFPYAARFAERHGCRLTVAMSGLISPLLQGAYPGIRFVTHEQVDAGSFYATYSIGLFFDDTGHVWQPCDFRLVGLHRTAAYILGVDPAETRPLLDVPDAGRPLAGPYVCIAVQSSSGCKYWTNPAGWLEAVRHLQGLGYTVVCIDQRPTHGHGLMWTHIPHGARDETGHRPLAERVGWLRHAAFFVGLSSGLAWLAWAAGTPVVLISGFTHPVNEFETPYRVINWHACNSCWNDPAHRFDHHDFLWCPRHAGTPRQFECTRLITPAHVLGAIDRAHQAATASSGGQ